MTETGKLLICMPVYNDWQAAAKLIHHLDRALADASLRADVMIVNDGSTEAPPSAMETTAGGIGSVEILHLRRNVNHQRAIAIGLAHICEHRPCDAVVVMDADGEDSPEGVVALINAFQSSDKSQVIFAQRRRRAEGLLFRSFYILYKSLHWTLVGRGIDVGNFSIVPRECLERLAAVSEMWNHYAASVFHARIPSDSIPIDRSTRLSGRSRMNFVSWVVHGLCAISVYGDVVAVRLLVTTCTLLGLCVLGLIGVVVVGLATQLVVPVWAATAGAILGIVVLQLVSISSFAAVLILHGRTSLGFVPSRDYHHFTKEVVKVAG
jgi:glycosyltransferase involved in cell wall biosynthesis